MSQKSGEHNDRGVMKPRDFRTFPATKRMNGLPESAGHQNLSCGSSRPRKPPTGGFVFESEGSSSKTTRFGFMFAKAT